MMRIRELRLQKGLKAQKVADDLNLQSNTYSRYELEQREPPIEMLKRIADYFGVSVDYLTEHTGDPAAQQFTLLRRGAVPIVGAIACGAPILAEQNIEGYADVPEGIKADFALCCRGDSMEPTFRSGDIVLLRQQPDVLDGQIAAVLINGEATLKHVYHQSDSLLLVADNPAYAPMTVKPGEGEYALIQGLAVGFTRMFR